jgi:hypothetical protein
MAVFLYKMFWLFLLWSASAFVFYFNKEIYITNNYRGIYYLSLLIMPAIYVLMVLMFDNLSVNGRISKGYYRVIYKVYFYTYIPVFLMLTRYVKIDFRLVYFVIFTIVMTFIRQFIKNTDGYRLYDIKYLLVDVWSHDLDGVDLRYYDQMPLNTSRKPSFYYAEGLSIFQDTYCDYNDLYIGINEFIRRKVDVICDDIVLDIGGYDGAFSSKVLNELPAGVAEVDLIDPVDKYAEYSKNLRNNIKVNFYRKRYDDYKCDIDRKYKLIVASHSLYSCIDDKSSSPERILDSILGMLCEGGVAIIIMGNEKSAAYRFKADVLYQVYLSEEATVSSKNYIDVLRRAEYRVRCNFMIDTYDTYFRMTDVLDDKQRMIDWISYFIRVSQEDSICAFDEIKSLMKLYCYQYASVVECAKGNVMLSDSDVVMPHKVDVIFLMRNTIL